jgi:hypothetical protein
VARMADCSPSELQAAADQWLQSQGSGPKEHLEDLLLSFAKRAEIRPSFAAFYEDVANVFESGNEWADELRDCLGLAHLDPAARGREITIVVFRYPVSAVAKMRGLDNTMRPLARPTVLDGRFSSAFCPAPRFAVCGYVIDLSGKTGVVRREIVHPTIAYRAGHLWRLGTVRRRVEWDSLATARGLHLIGVRELTQRLDYGIDTDRDL